MIVSTGTVSFQKVKEVQVWRMSRRRTIRVDMHGMVLGNPISCLEGSDDEMIQFCKDILEHVVGLKAAVFLASLEGEA